MFPGAPCFAFVAVAGSAAILAAAEPNLPVVEAVRHIDRITPLVVQGQPPALLLPASEDYQPAKRELLQGLAQRGIPVEEVHSMDEADPARRTVICLGNMLTNPLIERLYWNRYTFLDALTPGPGNYLIHTVYDPYPYNGGHNVILIGCSDPAGARLGVERFLGELRDGSLPYLVAVGPQSPVSPAQAAAIAARKPDPTFCEFTENANRYLQTGCDAYAQKAIAALEIVAALYEPGGERSVRSSSRVVLPWPEETTSGDILAAWDAFEECPLLSDEQRLRFTNAFLQFTRDLVMHVSGYRALGENDLVSWNHTTFPLLGLYFGARYFHRYYHLPDMPEKLAKAKACFLAQARSWKPQEDADGYVIYTPEHTITYCLAEGQMDYFTCGNLKRYADYMVGICDNAGLPSGFGDSGFSTLPTLAPRVLPLAFWWTGDGGYRWLMEHYTRGAWRNPFERGVPAVRPDRFLGVNVFPLDAQVYEYTQTRPYYNEPLSPSEVPLERAFDKITFRDNWERDGQYLILDGFARGKHLHYDGNAIIEFVEGGERWLLDHDYLTRNTTEHAMLSILRRGRCDVLEPSLASLEQWANLPQCGYSHTAVPGYNGCDWHRQILWQRGEWFLVADTVIPRETDSYDFDLTWKTMDCEGRQRIEGTADFVAERGEREAKTRDCTVVNDADAPGGKAILFDRPTSRLAFGVDLPAGTYTVLAIARGTDGSSDSLWISIDGGEPLALHVPTGAYGPSGGDFQRTTPTAAISLKGKRRHLVLVTLREDPPVRVARFVFRSAQGKETVYSADALPPAPTRVPILTQHLAIKPAYPVEAWVTNHERKGISVPVSILHQRQSGTFRAGEPVRFASLVYTSLRNRRRNLKPVVVAENLIAIQGSDPSLALLGNTHTGNLEASLEAGLATARTLMLAGLRRFRVGDLVLSASAPTDVQFDLETGQGSAKAPNDGAHLSVSVGGREQALTLPAGESTFRVPNWRRVAAAGQVIQSLIERRHPTSAKPTKSGRRATTPHWSAFAPGERIACLKVADLKDGLGPRLFVCRGPELFCLGPEGDILWQFAAEGRTRDVAFGELRPTPGLEVVVGSMDCHLYLLSAEGRLLEKREMRGTPWARSFGDRAYAISNVGIWDVNGDGQNEILVTLANFDLQALSAEWKLLWKSDYALHGSMQLGFEDTNEDGQPDTVFVADKYGSSIGVSGDGKVVHRCYTSIGDVAYALAHSAGEKAPLVLTGSSTGDLVAVRFGQSSNVLWRFDHFGYAVNRLRCGDINGDGNDEVLVALGSGYVYALDNQGRVLWQDRAGRDVSDLILVNSGQQTRIAYCDAIGIVRLTDGSGNVLQEWYPPAAPQLLAVLEARAGKRLVVGLADGRVVAYPLR